MMGPVEWSSKVSSSTVTAIAISSSDAREAVLNMFKPAKSCFCTEEVSGKVDMRYKRMMRKTRIQGTKNGQDI